MASLDDFVLDSALNVLTSDADELHLCSAEPLVYANVATYTLGNKASPTVSSPADRAGGGREVTISAFTDGTVTTEGNPTHWALIDTVNSRLLAVGAENTAQTIYVGNPWSTAALKIGIPDPA